MVVLKLYCFSSSIYYYLFLRPPFSQINHTFFLIQDERNFSSQLQPSDNRTIQSFVEAYVDSYIGEYTVARHLTELLALIVEQVLKHSKIVAFVLIVWLFMHFLFKMD